jgi:four helix bundle protein
MKYNLEARLIRFAVSILDIGERMPDNKGSTHLAGQLIRCGTAPSLMYAEALSAESRKDFLHKMKLALKELRETSTCLQIILLKNYLSDANNVRTILKENSELIAIFVTSVHTTQNNLRKPV